MSELTWHVAQCASRAERLAAKRLRELGYPVLWLHQHELRNHGNRKVEIAAPLLPGYTLIAVEPGQGLMGANTCPGVVEVLHIAGRPQVVPMAYVERWQGKVAEADPVVDPSGDPCALTGCLGRDRPVVHKRGVLFRKGEAVLITDGPFEWLHGVVEEDRGRPKVKVIVTVLGRAVSVEIRADWLEPLTAAATPRMYAET